MGTTHTEREDRNLADNKPKDKLKETRVFEVRKTTYLEKTDKERTVFELNEDTHEWELHLSAPQNFSLSRLQDMLALMKNLPKENLED